jgi:hypothetical protein
VRLVFDPLFSEVDLMASAEELSRLAGAVAAGEGLLSSTASPGSNALEGVEVKKTSGPGVLIHLDLERQILVISGDSSGRAVLADNLLSAARQRRIRSAGGAGVRGPDPRRAGRSHRPAPGRTDGSKAAHACPCPERAASSAARPCDHSGDRGLRGRMDVRVPRALGGAVMVESWLKRRSRGGRARRVSL